MIVYEDELLTLHHGDARELLPVLDTEDVTCLVVDPPYDSDLIYMLGNMRRHDSELLFSDPRHVGEMILHLGAPQWLFAWDTMSSWNTSAARPLTQIKYCAWYGCTYSRDAQLWGDKPDRRSHPTTKFEPLDGRRLTDLWRESLRWLHHPTASTGQAGTERFSHRQSPAAMRHAKPEGWVRCLIGNTTPHGGTILDPFAGSGTTLRAARAMGRKCVAVEIDEEKCDFIVRSLSDTQPVDDDQPSLFEGTA